jgi:Cys-tRNA(Pro)/Cys-tRNA(Cys) deacylase
MKVNKTNVARLLDKAKVAYELIPYEVDESDLSAIHVAEQLGEDVNQVFKTLVLKGDKTGFFVCVIPGQEELDLKLAAKVSGNKNCDMIPMKELLPTTGYIRGACSPVGMKKQFPTFIHETCLNYQQIYVSAGQRGLQIRLSPSDLIREVRATANAGILGADYNYGDSFGKLVRQGEEYNRGLEDTVYKFNQATNLANQNNAMEAQKINAETSMNNRRYMADAYSTAAKLNYEDALARDNAISGNFTNLFENLGNIGRENYLSRQVGWKLQKGLDGNYSLGDMGTIQNTYGISDKQLRDWATNQGIDNDSINSYFTNRSNSSKNGGKIRTRRTRRTF